MPATPPTPASDAPAILVCDDSAIERAALAQYLRRFGYEVHEVPDGQSAIRAIRQRDFDLLILDLLMPGVSGFDVLVFLQQRQSSLPVILLSGLPLDQIEQRCFDLPSSQLPPLLLKPVDLDDLMQIVPATLRARRPDVPPPANLRPNPP